MSSTWLRDNTFDIWYWFNNSINSIAIQNDWKIIVWWSFVNYKWQVAWSIIRLNGDSSSTSISDTTNTWIIKSEFESAWYIVSWSTFSWTQAISFSNSSWVVPIEMKLRNGNNKITLPKDIKIKNKDDNTDYNGLILPPTPITTEIKSWAISAITVWSQDASLKLTDWLATIQMSAPWKSDWDSVIISYSENNWWSWNYHSDWTVSIIDWAPYVVFTTDHFTDYVIEANWSGWVWSWTSWTLTVNIVWWQRTCSYPWSINISETSQAAFSSWTISWNFTSSFVCLDLEWSTETRSLTIQSSLLTNSSNVLYTIPAANIEFKTDTVVNTSWSNCNLNPWNTWYVSLGSTRTILWKLNDFWAICEITAPNPNIKITVPWNQPVWTYTATLTYTII